MSTRTSPSEARPLDHPLLDRYLTFVEARARRNTVIATASDLRVFFAVVSKEPPPILNSRGRRPETRPTGPVGALETRGAGTIMQALG